MIIRDAELRDARGVAEGLFRRGARTLSQDLDRHFERLLLLVQRDRGDLIRRRRLVARLVVHCSA